MQRVDDLVGRRVALRYRIGERAGRPCYSDAVGELAVDGDALLVRTRRGPVRVARAAVVAVRAVPPPPPRRASWAAVARLENLCADAWPARVDRPLGQWRLRAAGGFTGRANSALATGDPGVGVPAALDAVRRFAAEHAIPPRVMVPVGSPWDRAVARTGWGLDSGHEAGAEVAVLVADLADLASSGRAEQAGSDLPELAERPLPEWWRLAVGGRPTTAQRDVLDPGGEPPTAFGLARDRAGAAVGALRATVVADHLHLSRLVVAPSVRRRGVGTALTASAAVWGRARGARWAVLQVALHDTDARAFHRALGCTEHHRYRYLVP